MKNKKTRYSKIKNIKDLHRQKRILETKLKIRKHLFNRHVNDFSEDFSGDYVFRQSLKSMKLDNPLYSFLPGFFKDTKVGKGLIIPLVSGLGVAITTLFLSKKKENESEK